jgi:hypothetical protein
MQETKTQKEERKNMYISYVLAHAKGMGDSKALIKEASLKWEKNNKEDSIK